MTVLTPDERAFRADLDAGAFQSGLDRGQWRLVSIAWPNAVIAVAAATCEHGPGEYALRFDLTNYPSVPPTAVPWDLDLNGKLEFAKWPGGTGRVTAAFNPGWQNGVAVYIACDRLAIASHDQWPALYPDMIWSPQGDITQYLRIVYDLLHSKDYTGPRGS